MNKQFIFGTLTGAAAGAGIMFVAMREYFKAKAEAEVNEVREFYKSEYENLRKDNDEIINNAAKAVQEETGNNRKAKEDDPVEQKSASDEYEEIVQKQNYSDISEQKKPKKERKKPNKPYYITPEHFNEEPGFSKVTLDYWAGNNVFTNIEGSVEEEAGIWIDFEHNNEFGVYEDELMYVRNDALNTDYEVMYHKESYEGDEDIE